MNKIPTKKEVQAANIELHTALADVYNKEEPHWRPENVNKVKSQLRDIKNKLSANHLLDLGCGTGFMIEIAKDLKFKVIHGCDITPAMLSKVNLNYADGEVKIFEEDTGNLKREHRMYDVVTAYTFLSHLDELNSTFKNAYNCLRDGGVFFSSLDPNAAFWAALEKLNKKTTYHNFIEREIKHSINNDKVLEEKFGISPEVYNTAEYFKSQSLGIEETALRESLTSAGFKDIEVSFDWFVGQGLILNDPNKSQADKEKEIATINSYLQACMPMTKNLFKYVTFKATK
jgi:2-polyprenyl-3-methyl-5-hydroxy-6-metoxy-1,4-benzoquinol methylase